MQKLGAEMAVDYDALTKLKSAWTKKNEEVQRQVEKPWGKGRWYPQPQSEPTQESYLLQLLREKLKTAEGQGGENFKNWTHSHRLCSMVGHNFHTSLNSDGTNTVKPPAAWNTDRVFLEDHR